MNYTQSEKGPYRRPFSELIEDLRTHPAEHVNYNPPEKKTQHRTLADLIEDLIAHPDELFIRDRGCEALVYVSEFNEILHLELRSFHETHERETALRRLLNSIKEERGVN